MPRYKPVDYAQRQRIPIHFPMRREKDSNHGRWWWKQWEPAPSVESGAAGAG